MPHSSGGGSHSGGSHHSSHSSSRGSGGSSRPAHRSGNKPFAGSTRYLYYKKGQPVFVYSNYDIVNGQASLASKISSLVFTFLILFFFAAIVIVISYSPPKKLETDYDTTIYIQDNINVLDDTAALEASLTAFRDKTGITPAVLTITNEDWNTNYNTLENYAFDAYINNWEDEKHWLIVYSCSTKEDGFEDWYFEGMQGDDTDDILSEGRVNDFIDNLTKYLGQNKLSVDEAIAKAFDELTPIAMQPDRNPSTAIIVSLFGLGFFGITFWASDFHPIRDKYYKTAKICDPKFVDQENCEYCGGIYIVGMHTTCPHCGAAVKAHDFMTDENGNIKQIIN